MGPEINKFQYSFHGVTIMSRQKLHSRKMSKVADLQKQKGWQKFAFCSGG